MRQLPRLARPPTPSQYTFPSRTSSRSIQRLDHQARVPKARSGSTHDQVLGRIPQAQFHTARPQIGRGCALQCTHSYCVCQPPCGPRCQYASWYASWLPGRWAWILDRTGDYSWSVDGKHGLEWRCPSLLRQCETSRRDILMASRCECGDWRQVRRRGRCLCSHSFCIL